MLVGDSRQDDPLPLPFCVSFIMRALPLHSQGLVVVVVDNDADVVVVVVVD